VGKLPPLPGAGQPSPPGLSLAATESTFQSKLQDAFFHQHPDLREICEFAAGKMLPLTLSNLALDEIIPDLSAQPRSEAYAVFYSFTENKLKEYTRQAISSLVVRSSDKKAVDVAVALTVARVLRSNNECLQAKVAAHYENIVK
jgi:hypothetical protein